MTRLYLEKTANAVLLTVPPMKDEILLERALGCYRVSKGLNWPTLSKTEPTVLVLPLLRWKEILYALLLEFDEGRIVARHAMEAAKVEAMKLEFVLDGAVYGNVSTLPKTNVLYEPGSFQLSEAGLRVSDPCYDKKVRGATRLDARAGTWKSRAELVDKGSYGFVVARLTVVHADFAHDIDYHRFERVDTDIDVDSGICGFFDDGHYPKTRNRENPVADTFYRGICDLLVSRSGNPASPVITVPGECGAASQTYDGDGSYVCRVFKDESGKVVAAYLWFAPYADPYFPDEGDYEDNDEEEGDDD